MATTRRDVLRGLGACVGTTLVGSCGGGGGSNSVAGPTQPPTPAPGAIAPEVSFHSVDTGAPILADSKLLGLTKIRVQTGKENRAVHIVTGTADAPSNKHMSSVRSNLLEDVMNPGEYWLPIQMGDTSVEIQVVELEKPASQYSNFTSVARLPLRIVSFQDMGEVPGQVAESYYIASIYSKEEAIDSMEEAGDPIEAIEALKAVRDMEVMTLDYIQETLMYGSYEYGLDSVVRTPIFLDIDHLQLLDQLVLLQARQVLLVRPEAPTPRTVHWTDFFIRRAFAQSAAACTSSIPISPENARFRANLTATCLADMEQYRWEAEAHIARAYIEGVNFAANAALVFSPLGLVAAGGRAARFMSYLVKNGTAITWAMSRAADTVSILAKAKNGQTSEAVSDLVNVGVSEAVNSVIKMDSKEMERLVQAMPVANQVRQSVSAGITKAVQTLYRDTTKDAIKKMANDLKTGKKKRTTRKRRTPRKPVVIGAPPTRPRSETVRDPFIPPPPAAPRQPQTPGYIYFPSYPAPCSGNCGAK